ncbi:peptidoglycan D,D-transpeptidase FtsI family protein [Velocimicrobium porci]|uniref:Penicillin-binding protein 2 n=1 Tax=Velocimicrobium porci TaxID=2606634 RepID=A0A6L5XWW5_9FIRM|nr:penicillin-binding protein 2 [Velocimicrobium porci]MSS63037.1 penicillin-binding protein 2 [Velocimicrobium porci]
MRRDKGQNSKRFTAKMQSSLLFVFCIVFLCFLALVVRLVYLNNKDGDKYERRVLAQQTYVSSAIPFKRGNILDRNMTKLAVSEKVYNLTLDPVGILEKSENKKETIQALNQCFEISKEELETILEKHNNSRYFLVQDHKGLEYDKVSVFKKMQEKNKKIVGVYFEEEYIRKYPLKNIGSNVIGFTQKGNGNIGTWGIEEFYNDELNGTNGREYGYFDAELNLERTVKGAVDGHNIISTIDANVQAIVEKKVEKFLDETGAENLAVLVMNPQNGEIYSMVSNYSFDLNDPRNLEPFYSKKKLKKMSDEEYGEALSKLWRNYCISDAYEPGSTFKPFTVAAALDEAKATNKSSYVCNGASVVAGQRIRCNKTHNTVSLKQSLMMSCNVAMMDIAAKMGKSVFADYLKMYGFGAKTGIDLPGEGTGLIFTEDQLGPVQLATSSFGQSNTVTMVQLASGFCSLINGGNYYKPHIVKEIQNENGATIKAIGPTLVKETISESASEKIRNYLFATVEAGTAKSAGVEGYEIGGKTGTAETQPRKQGNYLVSFIGFTPIEDPQVVTYVIIDRPHVDHQANSGYATELASDIMKDILPFLGVYPTKE